MMALSVKAPLLLFLIVFAYLETGGCNAARLQTDAGQCSYNVQVWQPNEDVQKKMSDMEYEIDRVTSRVNQAVLTLRVEMLQEVLNERNATVNVERQMKNLAIQFMKLDADLQSTKNSLDNVDVSLSSLTSSVDGVDLQNKNILAEQNSLNLENSKNKEQLTVMQKFTSQLRNNLGDLKGEWILTKREMRNIQGENIQLKMGQNDLQTNVVKLKDSLSNLGTVLESLKADLSALRTETDDEKKRSENMRLSLTRLREEQASIRLETLKTQQRLFHVNLPNSDKILKTLKKYKNAANALDQRRNGSSHDRNTDCQDVFDQGSWISGLYKIWPRGEEFADDVYCEMADNLGWTIIQRRIDGSQDFNRHWLEYKYGFGNPYGEFWMGNEKIHHITSQRKYQLRIDLWDWEGGKRYAEYALFSVGDERNNYRLHVQGYQGNAGDSLSYHDQMEFSTKDMDNDKDEGNCAEANRGGWWFKNCYASNLNGAYKMGWYMSDDQRLNRNAEGIVWYAFKGSELYSLKKVEMKIRPRV